MSRAPRWRSRLRPTDILGESWLQVSRQTGRAVFASLGIALGIAAIVATLTLVATIRFQVSDSFDALLATQIDVRSGIGTPDEGAIPDPVTDAAGFPPADDQLANLSGLSGVDGVAVLRQARLDQPIAPNRLLDPTAVPATAPVHLVNTASFAALDLDLEGPGWDTWHETRAERVAVIARPTADAIGMSDIMAGDRIFIKGLAFTVVGVLDDAPRLPALRDGVLLPVTLEGIFELDTERDRIITVVAPGAAPAVTTAAPLALSPTDPDAWIAYAPTSDQQLRQVVDDQLETLALGLGGIVLLLGIVSIGNVTLSSVLQRLHEIGLRRALGARPRHIAAHILLDAGITGALGGAFGALLGLCATLGVTIARGWVPVIDLRIPATTIAIGFIAGIFAGLYPARVASCLQPTEALRRG